MRVVVSWSGGKESGLACYEAIHKGFEVAYLLNMITEDAKVSMTHGISSKLLHTQSQAIGIPIVQRSTTWNTYEKEFKKAVSELKQQNVEGVVFGDIDLPEHRSWNERVCNELNVKPILPLWEQKREQILNGFIDKGFEALIVSAKADLFENEWVGHKIDRNLMEYLHEHKIDLCGESGEYHTFVTNGPIFRKRIKILESRKIIRDGYGFLDILRYEIHEK
ncbi:MAG: diphthine--ammonia ligase [Candidatus Bathyarchaeota archaeon]